jgi:hypothetical protein
MKEWISEHCKPEKRIRKYEYANWIHSFLKRQLPSFSLPLWITLAQTWKFPKGSKPFLSRVSFYSCSYNVLSHSPPPISCIYMKFLALGHTALETAQHPKNPIMIMSGILISLNHFQSSFLTLSYLCLKQSCHIIQVQLVIITLLRRKQGQIWLPNMKQICSSKLTFDSQSKGSFHRISLFTPRWSDKTSTE